MRKLLVVVTMSLLFTGCNNALTFSEVDLKSASDAIIEGVEKENGYYLITTNKQQYVFLNQGNVKEGEMRSSLAILRLM